MNKSKLVRLLKLLSKYVLSILLTVFVLVIVVVLLLNVPAVQTALTRQVGRIVSDRTGTEFSVGSVKIAFPKTLQIKDVYAADQQQDTLVYLGSLKVDVNLWRLIRQEVLVNSIYVDDLTANVLREDSQTDFNYQFIIDAFASDEEPVEEEISSTSPEWEVMIGKIAFSNFRIRYLDAPSGLEANLNLGNFETSFTAFDLDKFIFDLDEIILENTLAAYTQWPAKDESGEKATDERTDESGAKLPDIALNRLVLNGVTLVFNDREANQEMFVEMGELTFSPRLLDLNNRLLDLGNLNVSRSEVSIKVAGTEHDPTPEVVSATAEHADLPDPIFPDWNIQMNRLLLDEVTVHYRSGTQHVAPGSFNPDDISLNNLSLEINDIYLSPQGAGLRINSFAFDERSGFNINQLALQLAVDEQNISLTNLDFVSGKSNLKLSAALGFERFNTLINEPALASIKVDVKQSKLYVADFKAFAGNALPNAMDELGLDIGINIDGHIGRLNINEIKAGLADHSTTFTATGKLAGLPDAQKLEFEVSVDPLLLNAKEITRFIPAEAISGYNLPDEVKLELQAAGKPDSLTVGFELLSSLGGAHGDAYFQGFAQGKDTFNLNLRVEKFNLGMLLDDPDMGEATLEVKAGGRNITGNEMELSAEGKVVEAFFNNYSYEDVKFDAVMKGETIKGKLVADDPNVDLLLLFDVNMADERIAFDVDLNVNMLNLHALSFADEPLAFKTRLQTNGYFASTDHMQTTLQMSGTEIVQNSLVVPVDAINLDVAFDTASSSVTFVSQLVDLSLNSNTSLIKTAEMLQLAWKTYLDVDEITALPADKTISFNLRFYPENDLVMQLIPDLERLEITAFSGNYSSNGNLLTAGMEMPVLKWQDIAVSDFYLSVSGRHDSLSLATGLSSISYDTLSFGNLAVTGKIKDGDITSAISIKEQNQKPAYYFNNQLKVHRDALVISFLPEGLILDGELWDIPAGNMLEIKEESLLAKNFEFSSRGQFIGLQTPENSLVLTLEQFNVDNLFNLLNLNRETPMVRGVINSEVLWHSQDESPFTNIDLSITDFYFMDTLVGDIFVTAGLERLQVKLALELQNPLSNISIKGEIDRQGDEPYFDLKGQMNIEELGLFEPFTFGYLTGLKGALLGEMMVTGTAGNPRVNGALNFRDATFNVTMFNFVTTLQDETISFDREGIHLSNFTLRDEQMRELDINGSVFTRNYREFNFDIGLATERFRLVNSTQDDNELLFGSLFVGAGIKITGSSDLPVVQSEILIDRGTALTYVLPGSEIELITHEGIVQFITPGKEEDADAMAGMGNYLTDSIISAISGIELSTNLRLHPEAKFTIIVDPVSGDFLSIGGEANLNFSIDQGGNQTLTGVFEVKQGSYQLSFYGLVRKSFSFEPGSIISWSGDIMDATIDLTAKHIVRTQSDALMANEATGMSPAERNLFRQRLPYEVLLNIRGMLSEPVVSFNIRLPERYMVNFPQIASKLNMLNSAQSESELNKQVFALLVIGSFMPETAFGGGGGSASSLATTAARNSVNGILTQQLNNLSDRYIRGFDVEFNLTSYDDYTGGAVESRTELDVQISRSFFNDRLTIEASGTFDLETDNQRQQGNPQQQTYGEFAVIYDLTPGGEFRLKAFRENAYDIFDGEVASSGIAFIIQRNFNHWRRKQQSATIKTPDDFIDPEEDTEEN